MDVRPPVRNGHCAVEDRNMIAVAHLAIARSQNTGTGISGLYTKEEAVIMTAFSLSGGYGKDFDEWRLYEGKLEKFHETAGDSCGYDLSFSAVASQSGIG